VSTPTISASQVKELRDRTGAGMMDCKRALSENDGDIEKSIEWLRVKGIAGAAKLAGREATEGTIQAYIHANGKVGVLVEVDCNTDFVARNEDFVGFAREVALHIAARRDPVRAEDDVPQDAKDAELRVFEGRPPTSRRTSAREDRRGKLNKWLRESCPRQAARQPDATRARRSSSSARSCRQDRRKRRHPALRALQVGGVSDGGRAGGRRGRPRSSGSCQALGEADGAARLRDPRRNGAAIARS
jgi:elongation factor Ts